MELLNIFNLREKLNNMNLLNIIFYVATHYAISYLFL